MAPYSFNIASALMTKVICVAQSRKTSVFFLTTARVQKAKLTVNFLAFPFGEYVLKLGVVVTTYISYKIPYFCENLSELIYNLIYLETNYRIEEKPFEQPGLFTDSKC